MFLVNSRKCCSESTLSMLSERKRRTKKKKLYSSKLSAALKAVAHSHVHIYFTKFTFWNGDVKHTHREYSHKNDAYIQSLHTEHFSQIIDTINLNAKYTFLHFFPHISMSFFLCRLVPAAWWLFQLNWATPAWHDKSLPCIFLMALTYIHTYIHLKSGFSRFTRQTTITIRNEPSQKMNATQHRNQCENLHFVTMPFSSFTRDIYSIVACLDACYIYTLHIYIYVVNNTFCSGTIQQTFHIKFEY